MKKLLMAGLMTCFIIFSAGYGMNKKDLYAASELTADDMMAPYKAGMMAKLKEGHSAAFIHFTGDACLLCKYQWAKVDKKKLANAALENGVLLYEYSIDKTWPAVLKDIVPYGVFGVPAYVFISGDGKVVALDSISGEDDIIYQMKLLKK